MKHGEDRFGSWSPNFSSAFHLELDKIPRRLAASLTLKIGHCICPKKDMLIFPSPWIFRCFCWRYWYFKLYPNNKTHHPKQLPLLKLLLFNLFAETSCAWKRPKSRHRAWKMFFVDAFRPTNQRMFISNESKYGLVGGWTTHLKNMDKSNWIMKPHGSGWKCSLKNETTTYIVEHEAHKFWIHPWKLTWHWKILIFNRKYIFNWFFFHCHVSFPGCNYFFNTHNTPTHERCFSLNCDQNGYRFQKFHRNRISDPQLQGEAGGSEGGCK